jgi:N-acetylglucosamine kinase-like BadF-type ATPase
MGKDNQDFYIGIDNGGTKCEILAINPKEKIISQSIYPSIHLSKAGFAETCENIFRNIGIFIAEKNINFLNCKGIGIGIAGARNQRDKETIRKIFLKDFNLNKVIIESDTAISLYSVFGNNDGLILISGTGSVLYGKYKSEIYRIGGWGWKIGDEGSGYYIGKKGIEEIVNDYDWNKSTEFTQHLENKFTIDKENILRKIYNENFKIQWLAKEIIQLAQKKNVTALKIIGEAAVNLTTLLDKFVKTVKPDKRIHLAFGGSLIDNKNILSEKLISNIKKKFGNKFIIKKSEDTPAFGAAKLAVVEFGKNKKVYEK